MRWKNLLAALAFCAMLHAGQLVLAETDTVKASELDNDTLTIDVLSFNVRYSLARDGENAWPLRKEMVAAIVKQLQPDFLGAQEAIIDLRPEYDQVNFLERQLPDYGLLVRGREVENDRGEATPIYYREADWRLDDDRCGTFWLSDTPDVPGSSSWGNDIPRITTWARFTHRRTGQSLYVYNTHFDHRSQPSREKSAELILRHIAERDFPAEPVVLMGDLNAGEDNGAITRLKSGINPTPRLVDSFRVLHPDAKDVGTFNGFRGTSTGAKIDYIFVLPETKVLEAKILHNNVEGRYPSDHYPVSARIELP